MSAKLSPQLRDFSGEVAVSESLYDTSIHAVFEVPLPQFRFAAGGGFLT